MRALEFKIMVDGLTLQNYKGLHREDKDFVIQQANKNHLSFYPGDEGTTFTGKHEDLFTFLYDVAYRFDIEMI